MKKREWAEIPGYEGLYWASEDGCIKSARKQLSPGRSKNGYFRVVLYGKSGQRVTRYVHRLVLMAFTPQESWDEEVDHINGDKANNSIGNLRWCSGRENKSFDSSRNAISRAMKESESNRSRVLSMNRKKRKPVECTETRERFESLSAAAESIGVAPSQLGHSIYLGHRCKGLHYRYEKRDGGGWDVEEF